MLRYKEYDSTNLFEGSWTNSRLIRGDQALICPEMNIKLTAKKIIPGYGVYGVSFNFGEYGQRLIYVGKFQGEKKRGRFGGNIVTERWRRHLYTISMRGHRVGCAQSRLKLFHEMIAGFDDGTSFLSALTEEQIFRLTEKDVGCQASLNRLLFSYVARNQLLTGFYSEEEDIAQVCGSFKFHYWQVIEEQIANGFAYEPKLNLDSVEGPLIAKYSDCLPVNDECKWSREKAKNFNPNDLIELNSVGFAKLSSDIEARLENFAASHH